jgi:hypothetical protein
MQIMIDLMFSLVLFAAFIGLLYGFIVMFACWREAGHLRADFDPLLGYELHPRIERFLAAPEFPPSNAADAQSEENYRKLREEVSSLGLVS